MVGAVLITRRYSIEQRRTASYPWLTTLHGSNLTLVSVMKDRIRICHCCSRFRVSTAVSIYLRVTAMPWFTSINISKIRYVHGNTCTGAVTYNSNYNLMKKKRPLSSIFDPGVIFNYDTFFDTFQEYCISGKELRCIYSVLRNSNEDKVMSSN